MRYIAIAESDIGIEKEINQDSVLIMRSTYNKNEVLMAIICDGMGGLAKGELASATVICKFKEWFDKELQFELKDLNWNVISDKWCLILKKLNNQIQEYGQEIGERLGTTFTGILIINTKYVVVHVGDTRLYYLGDSITQLTTDHTFVAREVSKGNLSAEQAKTDKRKNLLLQCIGASKTIEPQVIFGVIESGVYLLCSDGFRHKVSEEEIYKAFNKKHFNSKTVIRIRCKLLIKQIKQRHERDNISVVLIRTLKQRKLFITESGKDLFSRITPSKKASLIFSALFFLISIVFFVASLLLR